MRDLISRLVIGIKVILIWEICGGGGEVLDPGKNWRSVQRGRTGLIQSDYPPTAGYPPGPGWLNSEDAYISVPELIAKNGFPVETHQIQTDDGYLLKVHRIPYGRIPPNRSEIGIPRPIVLVQHAILADSSSWLMGDNTKALGYMLADAGYDVWLGNFRGNFNSRLHISMAVSDSDFWKFSYDQMGIYDLPAKIDYILDYTGQKDLHYIGFSLGTLAFWAMMNDRPDYNQKIRLMTALAPTEAMRHSKFPAVLLAPFSINLRLFFSYMGHTEFLPNIGLTGFLASRFCINGSITQKLCCNSMFLLFGADSRELNKTSLPVLLARNPAGTSTRTLVHYTQITRKKAFRKYDYGTRKNVGKYGTVQPPKYHLRKVKCPVAIYWGTDDIVAVPKDVHRLASKIPHLVRKYEVRDFSHLDFIFSTRLETRLNRHVISLMKKF